MTIETSQTHTWFQKKFARCALAAGVSLALTACGGGSDNTAVQGTQQTTPQTNQQTTPPTSQKSLSGTVADGYLEKALVCLDINANKTCDDGEPQATSTQGGAFTLNATQEQIDSAVLLVKIIAGQTIDEDEPDKVLDKAYVMTAPPGYTFVSPLSTMVQSHIEETGVKLDDAEKEVKIKLGTAFNLKDDYVAGAKKDDATKEHKAEFQRLHQVARVTAKVLANNMEKLETVAANNTGITVKDMVGMIVAQVLNSLDTIRTQVDKTEVSEATPFDPAKLAANESIAGRIAFNPENPDILKRQIEVRDAEKQTKAANLGDLLKGSGVHWFGGHIHTEPQGDGTQVRKAELEYGVVKYDSDSKVTTETQYRFDSELGRFIADTRTDERKDYVLTAKGWTLVGDELAISQVNADGSVLLTNPDIPGLTETVSGLEINIKDIFIREFHKQAPRAMGWAMATSGDARFSAEARAYKIKFTRSSDTYRVWGWDECDIFAASVNDVPMYEDSKPASVYNELDSVYNEPDNSYNESGTDYKKTDNGHIEPNDHANKDTDDGDEHRNNCHNNRLSVFSTDSQGGYQPATSLDQIMVDQPADISNIHTLKGIEIDRDHRNENGKSIEIHIVAEFVKDGPLNIYRVARADSTATFSKLESKTWKLRSVEGQQVAVFVPPQRVSDRFNNEENRSMILAVIDGYVRMGDYEPAENIDRDLLVNARAMEEMLAAFKADQLASALQQPHKQP